MFPATAWHKATSKQQAFSVKNAEAQFVRFEHRAMCWAAWLIAEMCYTLLSSARGTDFSPSRFRQSSRAPVMGFPPFQASQVAVISEMQAD